VLLRHRGLGEVEGSINIRHKFHGFVHCIEFNGVVQEEKIRLVVYVPFHLANQRLLLLPIYRAEDLFIEPLECRLRNDPSRATTESEHVIDFKKWKIRRIIPRRQGDIPRLLLLWLIQMAALCLLIVDCGGRASVAPL
jgi:hypothetical protein